MGNQSNMWMVGVVLIAGSAAAFFFLRTEQKPQAQAPIVEEAAEPVRPEAKDSTFVVHASINCPGMDAGEVDRKVMMPLVEQLKQAKGVVSIRSIADEGKGRFKIQCRSVDQILTRQNIGEAFAKAAKSLPADPLPPVLLGRDPEQLPFLWLVVTGETLDLAALSQLAEMEVRQAMQTVPGIAEVQLAGRVDQVPLIRMDRDKLQKLSLSITEAADAIQAQKLPPTVEEFGNIVLATKNGSPIRLRDVANVQTSAQPTNVVRWKGKRVVAVGVFMQMDVETSKLAAAIRDKVKDLQAKLPADVRVEVAVDATREQAEDLLVDLKLPDGTSVENVEKTALQLEKSIAEWIPKESLDGDPLTILDDRDSTQIRVTIPLSAKAKSGTKTQAISDLRLLLSTMPEVRGRILDLALQEGLPKRGVSSIEIKLTGFDLVQLDKWAKTAAAAAWTDSATLVNVECPGAEVAHRTRLVIDREKAAQAEVKPIDVVRTIELSLNRRGDPNAPPPKFVIRFTDDHANERDAIEKLSVPGPNGTKIPLNSMVSIEQRSYWKMLETNDGELCLTLYADPAPGVSYEAARAKLLSHLNEARTTAKIPALFKAE